MKNRNNNALLWSLVIASIMYYIHSTISFPNPTTGNIMRIFAIMLTPLVAGFIYSYISKKSIAKELRLSIAAITVCFSGAFWLYQAISLRLIDNIGNLFTTWTHGALVIGLPLIFCSFFILYAMVYYFLYFGSKIYISLNK